MRGFLDRLRGGSLLPPLALCVIGLALFGGTAPFAGLHLDDHGFHERLSNGDWAAIWRDFLSYVPGRNLYILYYGAIYKVLGPAPIGLHLFGLILDILNSLLAYAFARQFELDRAWGLAFAGLFLVYPNHAETHFWTSAVAMNLLSTTFVLAALLAAGTKRLGFGVRSALAFVLYFLAFFDYDQVFFLWPLLVWRLWPGSSGLKERMKVLWFASACLTLNLAHALLRVFSPVSSGGRPVPTPGVALSAARNALENTLVPMHKLPSWKLLHSWAGGPWATVGLAAALSGMWLAAVSLSSDRGGVRRRTPLELVVFGAAWFGLAYAPNLFWYVSARHNYLPSFGFLLAVVAIVMSLAPPEADARATRRVAAAVGFLAFGLAAAEGFAAGESWRRSAALLESFQRQAWALVPHDAGNLFVWGAPLSIGGAPAFRAPGEGPSLFSQLSRRSVVGGQSPAFGRRGVFFDNQVDFLGRDAVRRHGYPGMNLMFYKGSGEFGCAGTLELRTADAAIPARSIRLSERPSCAETLKIEVPVWLVSSDESAVPAGAPAASFSNGVVLRGPSAAPVEKGWKLTLTWTAPKGTVDFAAAVVLKDSSGGIVTDGVYAEQHPEGRSHAALWPLFDDERPPSSWSAGRAFRETWYLQAKGPGRPAAAEITLYAVDGDAPWRRIDRREAALP
ncbi:MAG: hypothetical protein HY078_05915 [Elusimicrobia bacterium]|nr:hypothetical protein [Elusimicrobiota bacterium]